MAVNEKPVFAEVHTTHGRHMFKPGDRMDGKVDSYVIQSALENGAATDSSTRAKAAADSERERAIRVAREIQSRAERPERSERDRDVPRLVQLPDGTFARAD